MLGVAVEQSPTAFTVQNRLSAATASDAVDLQKRVGDPKSASRVVPHAQNPRGPDVIGVRVFDRRVVVIQLQRAKRCVVAYKVDSEAVRWPCLRLAAKLQKIRPFQSTPDSTSSTL